MIPKKIHYCWFGHGRKNGRVQDCIASWKRLCPDYELIEWNESNYDVGKSLYTKLAYEQEKWAHVSDYARIDIVNRCGGIYFDTDVELLKSPDPLLKNRMFFAVEQGSRKINSGLGFGSEKRHVLLERLLQSYEELAEQIAAGRAEFLACTVYETRLLVPYGFRQKDLCQKLAGGIRVYSSEYFCPKKVSGKISRKKLTEKTYSIHHYEASWIKDNEWYRVKIRFSRELEELRKIIVRIVGEDNFRRWRIREKRKLEQRRQRKTKQRAEEQSIGRQKTEHGIEGRRTAGQWTEQQKTAEKGKKEVKSISLTVLTPTYNRAERLPALYESLKRQTDKSFRWVLCDDGSIDDTRKLAEGWRSEQNGFAMDYYWKENGGKHSAVNYAMKHIFEDYVLIADSDDYLTDDAVQYVRKWLLEVDDDIGFAGVAGLKGYGVEKRIGEFPERRQAVDATNLERRRRHLTGDKAEVYRARLLKKYPFPVFRDEKFLAESAVWNLIAAEGKKLRWHNKIIYIAQYLPDGLTNGGSREADSFRGYTYHQRLNFLLKSFPENICELARYIKIAEQKGLTDSEIRKRMYAGRLEYLAACLVGMIKKERAESGGFPKRADRP